MRSRLELAYHLIDEFNDSIFVIVPGSGRFISVNKKACISLGYSPDELLDMKVMDIEAALPNDFSWSAHVEALRNTGSMLLEGAHKHKDGSSFPIEVSLKYLVDTESDYIVAIARDITGRRQAEDEAKKRIDETERMNKLMVGRELKMEELRKEIKRLKEEIATLRSQ